MIAAVAGKIQRFSEFVFLENISEKLRKTEKN
jgi:hypothetical protein